MIRSAVSLTALFLALASACATNNPQTASPEPTAQPAQAAAKEESRPDAKAACRGYEVTGSRVPKQRNCKTRAN